jgi:hypothetical protein
MWMAGRGAPHLDKVVSAVPVLLALLALLEKQI